MAVKVAIGSDHAGFELKTAIRAELEARGHTVIDCGPFTAGHCDYPDAARDVARLVSNKNCDRGVLVCGTGIGMAIAANKFRGVRAAVCWDADSAKLARQHNDANVLCLGGRVVDADPGVKMLGIFLETAQSRDERHRRRLEKVAKIDAAERKA
jgi:ribose 5-phosphate isomerase B